MKKTIALAVIVTCSQALAVDYYYDGTGNLNSTSNWWTNTNGTGSNPVNFSTNAQLFNVQASQSGAVGGAWTISGTGSRLVIAGTGTVDASTNNPNITLDMASGGTYSVAGSYSNLTFGTLNTASTFVMTTNTGFSSSRTYPGFRYTSTSSTLNFGAASTTFGGVVETTGSGGTLRFTGNTSATSSVGGLSVGSGSTLDLTSGSGSITISNTGGLTNSGTIVRSGTGIATINFTGSASSNASWGSMTAPLTVGINSGRTVTFLDAFSSSGALTLSNAGTLIVGNDGTTGSIGSLTNTGTVKFNRGNAYSYAGTISGAGSIEQIGSGTTTLNASQSYGGTTTVTGGKLIAGAAGTFGAVPGVATDNIFVNGGTLGITGSDYTLGNTRRIVLGPTVGAGSGTGTFEVDTGVTLTFNGIVKNGTGTGALTKTGAGTLTLSNVNTYTGLTTVSGGSLNIGNSGSLASGNALTLGASGKADFANAGQTLGAVSNANTASNALRFSASTGTVTLASLTGAGFTRFDSNGIITGGISQGTVSAPLGQLTADISGGVVTAGTLSSTTVSDGTVNTFGLASITTLSGGSTGLNSLSATTLSGGFHSVTNNASITSVTGGDTIVNGVATVGTQSAGVLHLNGATSSIDTLNGGTVNLGATTELTVNSGSTAGSINGGGKLKKATAGSLTLSGTNTYLGDTLVTQGTLTIASTGSITSDVEVDSGATLDVDGTVTGLVVADAGSTLKGTGTITGDALVGGNLQPGDSPGTLTIGGDLEMAPTTVTTMEIASTSSFDLLEVGVGVGDTLTYDGKLNFEIAGSYPSGTTFDLFNFDDVAGDFTEVNMSGSYGIHAFTGSGIWTATGDGGMLFSFDGSTGVLSLSISAVPEPLTAAGVLLLTSRLLGRRSRVSM